MDLLADMAGLKILHVPYNADAEVMPAIVGGHVSMTVTNTAVALPMIKEGRLIPIAVTTAKRSAQLPDIPTIGETVPGVVSSGWIVLMAPAGTPDFIIQKVNADLRKVVAMPEVIERFQVLGTYTRDLTPEQTGEFIRSEERLWWPIVRQVNQKR